MSVIFEAENYRGLKKVRWAPPGACAIVGPNGSGKTTLLRLGGLIRFATERTLNEGLAVSGGAWGLRHNEAADTDTVLLSVTHGPTRYQLRIALSGFGVDDYEESVLSNSSLVLSRSFGKNSFDFHGQQFAVDPKRMCVKLASDRTGDPQLGLLLEAIQRYRVYRDYRLEQLRDTGSLTTSETILTPQGVNLFSMLRNIRDSFDFRVQYQFITEAMREAFPDAFYDLSFTTSGPRTHALFQPRLGATVLPISAAPNGIIVGLLHLAAVICSESQVQIAIDEFENSLHPHAIRSIIRSIREWSEGKSLEVALCTHSPVVLDCFNKEKENIFVMEPGEEVQPCRLTDLGSLDWLAAFSAGQIYADEEVGSPVLPADPSKR